MKKDLILLGYGGSIGSQVLDVLKSSHNYNLVGLAAYSKVDKLDAILYDFPSIKALALSDEKSNYKNDKLEKIYIGKNALKDLLKDHKDAVIFNAIVGLAGLEPTYLALKQDQKVLLANKESLVIGGGLIKKVLKEHKKASIIPVDSEHSALVKLLKKEDGVKNLYITCSGGALRDYPLDKLAEAKKEDVLSHPTWNMGQRITVDCATMVNKAFEVIEAHHLFDVPFEKIKVLLHDESLIHALVELNDNSLIAEIGPHDMRVPISYALNDEKRVEGNYKNLELTDLHFRKYDEKRYPLYRFILDNYSETNSNIAVINMADEVAVKAFLDGEINYGTIYEVIKKTISRVRQMDISSLEDIMYVSDKARKEALAVIEEIKGGALC